MTQSLLPLLTKLCQDLLVEPENPPSLSHLTLHLPLQAVSAVFRVGYDGSSFSTTFCVTPQRCLGSILMEPDGEYWPAPHMTAWET